MSTQYCTWTKVGRTLDDFKANFKPICIPEQSGGVARFEACRKLFFCPKKSSSVWCHYDYLSAPDRDGASPNSNRKYQTCLIFRTLERAASYVIPMIANESEQASPTGCCVLL